MGKDRKIVPMKISKVQIKHYKRFTDLTIDSIPATAKLVVLVGANGCGKTSLFEAFNHWYMYQGFRVYAEIDYQIKKEEGFMVFSGKRYPKFYN